jgi:hypothetical protein
VYEFSGADRANARVPSAATKGLGVRSPAVRHEEAEVVVDRIILVAWLAEPVLFEVDEAD